MKLAPKGMRDVLPEDALFREEVIAKIKSVFRTYGFVTIETPALEYLSTLRAKGGEEIDKQIFVLDDKELGLRFDLTVPLARVAATNAFTKPFKRYAIAPVWRKEEPQKGRFREFYQADVDIVGTKSMRAEAEILTIARDVLAVLGFPNIRILINNRKILDALAKELDIENKKEAVFRLLDKLDKVGEEKVKQEMNEVIGKDKTKKLFEIFDTKGDNKKKLMVAEKITKEGAQELKEIISLCNFPVEIDLALVRGLGYYTGPVFEIRASDTIGSVAGGGRYDNLLNVYGQADYATGISLGLERIIILLKERIQSLQKTPTRLFVAGVKPELYTEVVTIATELRKNGIPTEVDLNERNLRKQLEYVNSLSIPFMIVVGERELKEGKFTLRDMKTGKEEFGSLKEIIKRLQFV